MQAAKITRRSFIARLAGAAVGASLLASRQALASLPAARSLAFEHTHTGEKLSLVYAVGGDYLPDSLQSLNRFLRDHYSGEVGRIDPGLYDQLHQLQLLFGREAPFQVISAYRCPSTNERLRRNGAGGVAGRSLHLEGRALDIRLPGVALADLRDAALSMRAGGVGYYAASNFVHIDTGRVRRW